MKKLFIRYFRKIVFALGGFILIVIGVALLALPGPGLVVIALGLFVLSLEFEWADKYFKRLRGEVDKYWLKIQKYFRR